MINAQTLPTTSIPEAAKTSKAQLITGRVLWAIVVPFLLMDATMHVAKPDFVVQACDKLQIPVGSIVPLGIVQFICLALYIFPRTAALGAVLLTGYLGGAMAIHMRIGDPMWFPVLVGALLWGSLYLRDARVRSFISNK